MFDPRAWQALGRKLASPPAIMVVGALAGVFYTAEHRVDIDAIASVRHDPFIDSAVRLASVAPATSESARKAVTRTASAISAALRSHQTAVAASNGEGDHADRQAPVVLAALHPRIGILDVAVHPVAQSNPYDAAPAKALKSTQPVSSESAKPPVGEEVEEIEPARPTGRPSDAFMGPPAPLRLAMTFFEPAPAEGSCTDLSAEARTALVADAAPQSLAPIATVAVETDKEESGSGRTHQAAHEPGATDQLAAVDSDALVGPEIPEAIVLARHAANARQVRAKPVHAIAKPVQVADAAGDDAFVGPPLPTDYEATIVLASAAEAKPADEEETVGPPLPETYQERLDAARRSYEIAMRAALDHGSFVGPLRPGEAGHGGHQTVALHDHVLPFEPLEEKPFASERVVAARAPSALETVMAAEEDVHTVRYVRDVKHRIRQGETLSEVLDTAGLDARQVDSWISATRKHYNVNRIYPGQEMALVLDMPDKRLRQMKLEIGRDAVVVVERMPGGVVARREDIPYERRLRVVGGTVDSSLYVSAIEQGIPDRVISDVAEVLGWDLDFGRDLRPGDTYRVIYEELTRTDTMESHAGRVMAAEVVNAGKSHEAFYYEVADGVQSGYYDREGEGLGTAFLRYPVAFSRISSHFSKARYHPVLKKRVPHYGVDFAAPTGTPVKAVADGTVSKAGWFGGNGRFVKIGHDAVYESGYAHLSRIAAGIKAGSKVKKGDVIGYVGSTGLATGPHLHFAMYRRGDYIDPLKTNLPRSQSLVGNALAAFRMKIDMMDRAYAEGGEGEDRSTQVAALPHEDDSEPVQ